MRSTFATPRSISALKTIAARLRKDNSSLTQTEALDKSAQLAGFANYTHAQRNLPEVLRALALRCRWRDGERKGVEVLKYPLPWSASDVTAMQLKAARVSIFEAFDEGLYSSAIASSQSMARYWLVQAMRELIMMEATGLRPDFIKNHLPRVRQEFSGYKYFEHAKPPGADHLSAWRDPNTGDSLLLDEPYLPKSELHSRAGEREGWCKRYGFEEQASSWSGTYLPPRTRLFLLAKANTSIDLSDIETKLSALPDDFGSSDEDWLGTSELIAQPL
ncbi:conserved hypothetical protein [Pseudomonas veronii]|uniref:hypothetical protein n=1 Tax=Pseudomonas veronii TaxID=76761 RepID=UPI00176F403F|nr:hypothetical protein [Pseudomonas veronii]CAD0264223.1 conserved hypothetical protein [Pseudomonas veronii]